MFYKEIANMYEDVIKDAFDYVDANISFHPDFNNNVIQVMISVKENEQVTSLIYTESLSEIADMASTQRQMAYQLPAFLQDFIKGAYKNHPYLACQLKLASIRLIFDDICDYYNLDYNNGDVYIELKEQYPNECRLMLTVEAPEHWTVNVDNTFDMTKDSELLLMSSKDTAKWLIKMISETLKEQSVDEEFDELWNEDFGRHNDFTASQFLKMLERDKAFYDEVSARMDIDVNFLPSFFCYVK